MITRAKIVSAVLGVAMLALPMTASAHDWNHGWVAHRDYVAHRAFDRHLGWDNHRYANYAAPYRTYVPAPAYSMATPYAATPYAVAPYAMTSPYAVAPYATTAVGTAGVPRLETAYRNALRERNYKLASMYSQALQNRGVAVR
jgi:hypothetical protein